MRKDKFNVGIYARLSRDDNNGNLESMSIANQRQILTDYVTEKGWNLVECYVDDGYSGTNFDRPDFKRLLRDIERGRINCVITKDLSRLGRNYAMTGYYTDEYFPDHFVRYIAINDGVDTMGANNDFAAFHNVINEFYPREISKKVRQVKRTNAEKGLFMGGRATYGYKKSPQDKHKLIIDEDASQTVVRVFELYIKGYSVRQIAEKFNAEGIICPSLYYYHSSGQQPPKSLEHYKWGAATITTMLTNQVYLGNLVQGCREVVSFKTKKRRVIPQEEWIIVEGTHEPIIDKELWDKAQKVKKDHIRVKTPRNREIPVFAGLVRCADCGSSMAASLRGTAGKEQITYRCVRYVNNGKGTCSSHNIMEKVLLQIVMNDIHAYGKLTRDEREELVRRAVDVVGTEAARKRDDARKTLAQIEKRIDEINSAVKALYTDRVNGKMPESFFFSLMTDYENELSSAEKKKAELQTEIQREHDQDNEIAAWMNMMKKFLRIKHLTHDMALDLIDSIVVSEIKKVKGKRTQEVTINYKFVGNLSSLLDKTKDAA